MEAPAANVFLVDGEDDFAIAGFITSLEERLGNPETANLNTTRLDGQSLDMDELIHACLALPFLSPLRLVIVNRPLVRLADSRQRERFKEFLLKVPPTTLLVLAQDGNLTPERDRRRNRLNWLETWMLKTGGNLTCRHFELPHGREMVAWIQKRAAEMGGKFTPSAAARLAGLVGDLPRRLDQEMRKLLEYVNYTRPVEVDDVEHLTPNSAPVADFALVNALRAQQARQAQAVLHKMLEEDDPLGIFHTIVSQFRQLILVNELMSGGAGKDQIAQQLAMHPYAVGLAMEHARHFSLAELDSIYQRLHELDYAIKTGKMDSLLALDLLVVELTSR